MEKLDSKIAPRTIPTPRESSTRRVTIAKPNATNGGNIDIGEFEKSAKFMIYNNQFGWRSTVDTAMPLKEVNVKTFPHSSAP
jgi:hypothetical protein